MNNPPDQLIDQYNRRLSYLRISLTDRCNLRCIYCLPEGGIAKLDHSDILTYEELLRLAGLAIELGISKIRLTGGEPLLRRGVYEFIPKLAALPGLEDISLTTNGIYLKDNIEKLRLGGIKRLNVSLDTLDPEKYRKITGYDGFFTVWKGLERAVERGFCPVKINIVTMEGVNDDEIIDFARLTLRYPFHVRFIEQMPIGTAAGSSTHTRFVSTDRIQARLRRVGRLTKVVPTDFHGPAERFQFAGAPGEIGFISPRTRHFCHECNRLRLTAAGRLRSCLLSDQEMDIRGPLRSGASDETLKNIFRKAARRKPHHHNLDCKNASFFFGEMSSLGG